MGKKRRGRKKRARSQSESDRIRVANYEITSEPILDARYKRLPRLFLRLMGQP
jgi:hypothetical protein